MIITNISLKLKRGFVGVVVCPCMFFNITHWVRILTLVFFLHNKFVKKAIEGLNPRTTWL